MFSERNKNGDSLSPADQYYKQCPLQNALYISAHLVLTLFTEQAFKVVIVISPISLIEETEAQASNFKKVI